MTVLPPSSGGDWLKPSLRSAERAAAASGWRGSMARCFGWLAAMAVLLAGALCVGLVVHWADANTVHEERRQQEMVLSFISRTLNARMETYQRVLQSMGQGIHSSMLDTPYLLELLLREEAGYAGIFDTLVMTSSDGGMVSYAPSGGTPQGGSELRDVLRRTLRDGKPQVAQMPRDSVPTRLGLLVTVPLRQADGNVRGALAGLVWLPLAGLLPQPDEAQVGQQYVLLDEEGNLLAHSDPAHAQHTLDQILGADIARWPGLSSSSTSNADSQRWGSRLVTRVGMPLPRWQLLALQDLAPRMLGMRRLHAWQWGALASSLVLVVLALWAVLYGLQRRSTRRRQMVRSEGAGSRTPSPLGLFPPQAQAHDRNNEQGHDEYNDEHSDPDAQTDPWQALEQRLQRQQRQARGLHSGLTQVLEQLPQGAIWVQGDVLEHVSQRAAHLLGHSVKSLQGQPWHPLLDGQPQARDWLKAFTAGMNGFGHYRGDLPWQAGDGNERWLHVEGMLLRPPAIGSVWLLEDARRQRQRSSRPQWQAAHDVSTGLVNRHQLLQQMQIQPQDLQATGQAVLWLDVDYFRALNATAGRTAGDEVLRQVAWLLCREQGAQGVAARVGGDEFVLWLTRVPDASAVQTLAWRLCEVVRSWTPEFGGQRYALGLSIGWLWTAQGGIVAQELLAATEQACRAAQREGLSGAVQAELPEFPRY